jgi:hypothetical protein
VFVLIGKLRVFRQDQAKSANGFDGGDSSESVGFILNDDVNNSPFSILSAACARPAY